MPFLCLARMLLIQRLLLQGSAEVARISLCLSRDSCNFLLTKFLICARRPFQPVLPRRAIVIGADYGRTSLKRMSDREMQQSGQRQESGELFGWGALQ